MCSIVQCEYLNVAGFGLQLHSYHIYSHRFAELTRLETKIAIKPTGL